MLSANTLKSIFNSELNSYYIRTRGIINSVNGVYQNATAYEMRGNAEETLKKRGDEPCVSVFSDEKTRLCRGKAYTCLIL